MTESRRVKSYKTSRKGRPLGLTHGLGLNPGLYEPSGKLPLRTTHSLCLDDPSTTPSPHSRSLPAALHQNSKILPEKVVSEQSKK